MICILNILKAHVVKVVSPRSSWEVVEPVRDGTYWVKLGHWRHNEGNMGTLTLLVSLHPNHCEMNRPPVPWA